MHDLIGRRKGKLQPRWHLVCSSSFYLTDGRERELKLPAMPALSSKNRCQNNLFEYFCRKKYTISIDYSVWCLGQTDSRPMSSFKWRYCIERKKQRSHVSLMSDEVLTVRKRIIISLSGLGFRCPQHVWTEEERQMRESKLDHRRPLVEKSTNAANQFLMQLIFNVGGAAMADYVFAERISRRLQSWNVSLRINHRCGSSIFLS